MSAILSPITRTLVTRLGAPVPSITRAFTINTPFTAASGAGAAAGFEHAEVSASAMSETVRAVRFMENSGSGRAAGTENVARGTPLQEACHPHAHVITDHGDAEPDHEHVEPRAADAASREH